MYWSDGGVMGQRLSRVLVLTRLKGYRLDRIMMTLRDDTVPIKIGSSYYMGGKSPVFSFSKAVCPNVPLIPLKKKKKKKKRKEREK